MQQATAIPILRSLCLTLAIINAIGLALCAILLFVVPSTSRQSARGRFTELDRAGVVNFAALNQFHPTYGFGNTALLEYRRTVPDFIAAPEAAQRTNATIGLLFALVNALAWLWVWRRAHGAPQPGP